jgi:DNA-binding IclR family transcriptional regulator
VISVAAPVFDWSAYSIGAVSVACIVSRWKPEREREIAIQVLRAATEVTRGIGGEPHRDFLAAAHRLTRD